MQAAYLQLLHTQDVGLEPLLLVKLALEQQLSSFREELEQRALASGAERQSAAGHDEAPAPTTSNNAAAEAAA